MDECWLKPNRRAAWPLAACPLLLFAVGAAVVAWSLIAGWPLWRTCLAAVFATFGAIAAGAIARWAQRPRLAYRDGELLVHLGAAEPHRVPIDVVEVFFRGQSDVPIAGLRHTTAKTSNIIVRLAEAAPQWHQRDIPATFGKWAEGYIILSGTWCEPITFDLLRQLNGRLAAVHRARRGCPSTEEPCGSHADCAGAGVLPCSAASDSHPCANPGDGLNGLSNPCMNGVSNTCSNVASNACAFAASNAGANTAAPEARCPAAIESGASATAPGGAAS